MDEEKGATNSPGKGDAVLEDYPPPPPTPPPPQSTEDDYDDHNIEPTPPSPLEDVTDTNDNQGRLSQNEQETAVDTTLDTTLNTTADTTIDTTLNATTDTTLDTTTLSVTADTISPSPPTTTTETNAEMDISTKNKEPPDSIPVYDPTKLSDDGYNSESYYSIETTKGEASQSLLSKPYDTTTTTTGAEGDPAYAVPEFKTDIRNDTATKDEKRRKRKSLRGLICGSTYGHDTPNKEHNKHVKDDDAKEKYYNPPVDIRDRYFQPVNQFPIIRVLLR